MEPTKKELQQSLKQQLRGFCFCGDLLGLESIPASHFWLVMNAFPLLPCGEQCAARTGLSGGAAHHTWALRPQDPTNMKKSPICGRGCRFSVSFVTLVSGFCSIYGTFGGLGNNPLASYVWCADPDFETMSLFRTVAIATSMVLDGPAPCAYALAEVCSDGKCHPNNQDCPPVTTDPTCGEHPHSGRDGALLTWGLSYRTRSAQECCNQCKQHPKHCNSWTFCGLPVCWGLDTGQYLFALSVYLQYHLTRETGWKLKLERHYNLHVSCMEIQTRDTEICTRTGPELETVLRQATSVCE